MAPVRLSAQAGGGSRVGSIEGTVFDSTVAEPLPNAAVFLWGTSYRTVTDSAGRYEFTHLPPGRYTVLFYHRRLGDLGISPGPRTITVAAGSTVEAPLAVPSHETILTAQCLLEGKPGNDTGTAVGWVGDAEAGVGLPGATVAITWPGRDRAPLHRREVTADGSGWYHACGLPAETPLAVSATFLDRRSLRREFTLTGGSAVHVDLLVGSLTPAQVSGRLVDAKSGEAVADAEVWLRGTPYRGLSGTEGRFAFSDVAPGTYMLMTDHLVYGAKMDTLVVGSGQTVSVEMRLDTSPIEIAPITVTVDAHASRPRALGGFVIPRSAIEKVRGRSRDVGDVLRSQHIAGIIVHRGATGVCVGFMPGQVRMMFRKGCVPVVVFINGVRATEPEIAVQISADAIERMVLYRPVEAGTLFGLGAGNGVLMIYTRNR